MRRDGDGDPGGGKLSTTRMEAISDSVFAFAITLLVLDLVAPSINSDVAQGLIDQWPSYAGYLVSFVTVGAAWIMHSGITDQLEHANPLLLRLNLLVLLFVALLPFPTHMVAAYEAAAGPERIGVTVYGINLLLISVSLSVVWRYAAAAHLIKPDRSEEKVRAISDKLTPSLGFYVVGIAIGLFLPRVAAALYLAIALFLLIPFRSIVRARRRRPDSTQ